MVFNRQLTATRRRKMIQRFMRTNCRKPLTWKSIVIFLLVSWSLNYVIVAGYCFLRHNLFFRFTSCPSDQFWPKNFSDIGTIAYGFEPAPCNESINDPSIMQIVLFIPVHVSRFERRNTIRETWAKPFKYGARIQNKKLVTKLVFVIGSASQSIDSEERRKMDEQLQEESRQHNDVLQLSNMVDCYYNITLKIRSVLSWSLKECPRATYIVRADSDIVLDYSNLLKFLFWFSGNHASGANISEKIAGYCHPYDCITRWPSSKTCLPRSAYDTIQKISGILSYGTSSFVPRYCFGFCYVLSRGFVAKALKLWSMDEATRVSPDIQRILHGYWPIDDAFLTGYIAEAMDKSIPRFNHPHAFRYKTMFDCLPCPDDSGVVASLAYEDDEEMKWRWAYQQEICSRDLIF